MANHTTKNVFCVTNLLSYKSIPGSTNNLFISLWNLTQQYTWTLTLNTNNWINLQYIFYRLCLKCREKGMAPHSSTLAWKIPWAKEPGRLQSMGSQRVGHDWATSLSLFTFMHWRRKWQPTPVFLPGESQGREPGGLPSMGSHRVGHDWCDLAAAAAAWSVDKYKKVGWVRAIQNSL